MTKLIWTKKAVDAYIAGQDDPRHTISAPNITDVYKGFVAQFKAGTPWLLVQGREILDGDIPA